MMEPAPDLRQRTARLNWAVAVGLAVVAAGYQFGPGRWLGAAAGLTDLVLYALIIPLLVFLALRTVERWMEENEQARREMPRRDRRLAQITATSADAIIGIDAVGRIESWNTGAELLFGFDGDQACGHPFSELLGGGTAAEVEYRWLANTVLSAGHIRGHETSCLHASTGHVDVELTATLLNGSNGTPAGMSVVLRNIGRRRKREQATQKLAARLNQQSAERNKELAMKVEALGRANSELRKLDQTRSEFVSLVSHQIRAPLTNMGGAVQRMQANCQNVNLTCARMFAIFDQQVNRLDRLVQDVLNASHLEAGQVSLHLEPVSFMSVVRQAVDEIQTRALTRIIHLEDKPGLPLVYADHDRVSEVIANLLDNADKYSPAGEAITVSVRADQTEVTVSIRDAGPGVPPGDLIRIFDKFYRADSSDAQAAYGYGLGLYVCRRLAEAQGGRIWAENHPDGGAVFSFALPVLSDAHV